MPRWCAACLVQRWKDADKKSEEEPWEEHPFVLPQPHFPVTIRRAKQPQVSTTFVLTLLSSPLVLRPAAFVVTVGVVSLPFVRPQRLRVI